MFAHLQIEDPAERRLVGLADLALRVATLPDRLRRQRTDRPSRVLVFRMERVGDLLMARPGLRILRRQFPNAQIDLVVGSWNAPLARLLPEVDDLHVLDLPWIARGSPASSARQMISAVRRWRHLRYDLGVNLEGDIRSHLLLRASGARRRAGFAHAGGGPLLTLPVPHDPARHVAWNILTLVAAVAGCDVGEADLVVPRLELPAEAMAFAAKALDPLGPARRILVVHPSGGRRVKQWPPERLARAAADLARRTQALLVVTGSPADRAIVEVFRSALPPGTSALDLTGRLDLVQLAAVLQRADLFLGCDSGPMHLAAAVGTPVLAVFGPSSPVRWGPMSPRTAAVRADLPCSPCNRVRRPPQRCRDRVPECLEAVTVEDVVRTGVRLLSVAPSGSHDARA